MQWCFPDGGNHIDWMGQEAHGSLEAGVKWSGFFERERDIGSSVNISEKLAIKASDGRDLNAQHENGSVA